MGRRLIPDVVVAPATPWGHAALAVVRLSGEGCHDLVARIVEPFRPGALPIGRPRRVRLLDGEGAFDDGVVVLGRAPRTATGEDTAEITSHGNPLIVERLVAAAQAAGARLALPGELTRRALERGKIDLVGAEGLLQVIEATSADGLRIGRDGLDGGIGEDVARWRGSLVEVTAELEARLDWPDDDLAHLDDATLIDRLGAVADEARALASTHRAGRALVQGARVALVGAVNAGKSSLLNALVGRARAIVSPLPGTTRDVVEVTTRLGGVQVALLDTAGERATDDPIEAAGLALARELTDEADLLVVVLRARPDGPDAAEQAILARTAARPRLVVVNHVDTGGIVPDGALPTVATTGHGVEALKAAMRDALVGDTGGARRMIASARQRDLLVEVADGATDAIEALPDAGVAVAADAVTRALEAIDALTGADTREDVLDALFARFCIGK